MPELFGARYTRAELHRRVGRLEQVAGVRVVTIGDGLGRGVRVLEFRTGTGEWRVEGTTTVNTGNTITYHNVVRRWVKLGDWTGAARSFTVPVQDVTAVGGDAVAVVVQAGTKEQPTNMLGAAVTSIQ